MEWAGGRSSWARERVLLGCLVEKARRESKADWAYWSCGPRE